MAAAGATGPRKAMGQRAALEVTAESPLALRDVAEAYGGPGARDWPRRAVSFAVAQVGVSGIFGKPFDPAPVKAMRATLFAYG